MADLGNVHVLTESQKGLLQRTLATPGWQIVLAYLDKKVADCDRAAARTDQKWEDVLQHRYAAGLLESIMRDLYNAAGHTQS